MAAQVLGRQRDTEELGGADDMVATRELELCLDVPIDGPGVVLFGRISCVLLGVYRGRGGLPHMSFSSLASANNNNRLYAQFLGHYRDVRIEDRGLRRHDLTFCSYDDDTTFALHSAGGTT